MDFSRRRARWWLFWRTIAIGLTTRPLFAREQLLRTFCFAMGSEAVFVPQFEAYRKEFVDWLFANTSLTFSEFVWGFLNLVLSTFSFF